MTKIKGIELNDIFGLSKLIDTVSRGAGVIYQPYHKKKMAKATAEEIQLIGEAIDQTGFPISYKNGEVSMDSEYNNEFLKRTFKRMFYQEIKKQENMDLIVEYAAVELSKVEKKEEISTQKVETDWALRFINSIEDVSDPEMQKIWGKILAGETKQPSKYNLRTLNILKNISRREAEIFKKVSQFILSTPSKNKFIIKAQSDEIEEKHKVDYKDLLLLEECGLINSNLVNFQMTLNNTGSETIYNSNIVFYMYDLSYDNEDEDFKEIPFSVYKVTEAGVELLEALNLKNNDEYAIDIFKEIKERESQKYGENIDRKDFESRICKVRDEEIYYDTTKDFLD